MTNDAPNAGELVDALEQVIQIFVHNPPTGSIPRGALDRACAVLRRAGREPPAFAWQR